MALSTHRLQDSLCALESSVYVREDRYWHPLNKISQVCMTSL